MRGIGLAAAFMVALAASGSAQVPTSIGHAGALMMRMAPSDAALTVISPSFADGGVIPATATSEGGSRFPGLRWSRGPAGTQSFLVVVQGSFPNGGTSIHLILAGIPASVNSLPAGLTVAPAGGHYGLNVHGTGQPYTGPHPHGPLPQPYHFQVLALDIDPGNVAATPLSALAAAIKGHVLASGETIGTAAGPAPLEPVRIDSGLVSGVSGRDRSITVYRGIPYAAPPVGNLRWRAPAAVAPWPGVREASAFGAACPQPGEMAHAMPQSEDCLTANVWTGAKASGEKRPVFVWIYGGGFLGGSGASPEFDGEGLAAKGIVVVTFNYRVGVLGFLATPALSRESGHAASGNYGLLDDIALLHWVQRNIAAFGGDPAKVTIGGQSAGAGSSGFMTLSPLARGLFRAAILESHARDPGDPDLRFLSTSYRTLSEAEAAGTRYATDRGATTLPALRAMSWQKLIEGSDATDVVVDTHTTAKPPLFRPVVDGWVLPKTYAQALASHAEANVTIIAGNNRDETGAVPESAFSTLRARSGPPRAGSPEVSVTLAGYRAFAQEKFGTMAADFLALYPASSDDEAARANDEQARDNNRVSTWLWATRWSPGTTRPVYTYWWNHAPPGPGHDLRGAYHGSEINYVFDNLYATDLPWTDEDRRIADTMSTYWANFMKTGNPNGPTVPQWQRFEPGIERTMRLGEDWGPIPIASSSERIAFWRRYYALQRQW